jgi:hypothetical protein
VETENSRACATVNSNCAIQNKKTNKLRGLSPQVRTVPTERPPLVGEVSANFSG